MAQRTRTTTTRVALAGAALILGAGLTGCMNDGKKPIKPIGPPATQTQTKMGGQPGYPTGPGQYPAAGGTLVGQNPGGGLGSSTYPGTAQPAGMMMTPGQPSGVGTPTRPTTGSALSPGTAMPGAGYQQATPAYNPTPGYNAGGMPAGAQSNYGGSTGAAQHYPVAEMAQPPAPPPSGIPALGPPVETTPPTASYPLAPAYPTGR